MMMTIMTLMKNRKDSQRIQQSFAGLVMRLAKITATFKHTRFSHALIMMLVVAGVADYH